MVALKRVTPSQSQLFTHHLLEWMKVSRGDPMFPQSRQAVYCALTSTPQVWFKKLSLVIMVAPHPSLFEDSAAGMKNNSTALSHRPNFKDIELPENDSAF